MGAKPKASEASRKTKSRRAGAAATMAEEKSQSERFIEAARAVGVDESGGEFERALNKLLPSKQKPKPK